MSLILRNIRALLHPRRHRAEQAEANRMLRSVTEATDGVADRIRGFLQSDAWLVRNCGIKIIARTRCEELYDVLLDKLADRSEAPIIRRNCAERIPTVEIDPERAIPALRQALGDPYWETRAEAARALARAADASPELEADLLAALEGERNQETKAGLAEALGRLAVSRAGFDRLAELANGGPWLVRHQAAVALLEMGARRPEFAREAAEVVRRLDLLAEGAATRSVFRDRMLELAALTQEGRPFPSPELLRKRYFHLQEGWLKPRA